MTKPGRPVRRSEAFRVIWIQLLITGITSLIALAHSYQAAYSAAMGGMICTVSNSYFVWKAFAYSGASNVKRIVRSFYGGEAGKIAITFALFTVVFVTVKDLVVPALFVGFMATLAAAWFSPLLIKKK